ncbi:MAG: zinc ribbon domain-containing protein [Candidatus Marinimicrobia bacterium]|nr:zinc ribbon domain-containing protein [Candidatus Neomarinimicrobiota bacterium]MCF7880216.1 zinc ribbon domain-containing protein [Candidatus Neomarinimicrobiota bacterium]
MRVTWKTLTLALALLVANMGFAQAPIQNFLISVWPEYDHPGVLVIFNGEVNEADLPMEVSFPIPEQSRFALVAGSTDTTANSMIPVPIEDGENGKQITFSAVKPSFHVEFYYNPFQEGNAHRHYSYDFATNHPIDSLIVDLQQPLAAQNFQPEIQTDHQMEDSHGIKYHRAHYMGVAAGEQVHIEAHYDNPQGEMTNNLLQSQMGEGGGQMGGGMQGGTGQASGRSGESNNSLWIIIGLVLVILAVLYYVTTSGKERTPREESAAVPEQGGEPQSVEPADKQQASGDTRYCIHCGSQIPAKANFCTKCGKKQGE